MDTVKAVSASSVTLPSTVRNGTFAEQMRLGLNSLSPFSVDIDAVGFSRGCCICLSAPSELTLGAIISNAPAALFSASPAGDVFAAINASKARAYNTALVIAEHPIALTGPVLPNSLY